MLLKHSWAEGRTGRSNNDKFTTTNLDTNEGLSYNQDVYRKLHHSYGKTFEIEDEVRFVRRIEERIVDIFTKRSKLTKQKIKRNWDRKDWWIDADECLSMGLVDEVRAMMPEHHLNKSKKKKKK